MNFGELSQWQLTPRTVSHSFRDIVAHELPGLTSDDRYWTFLEYLIFTRFLDEYSGDPCVPSKLVKQIGGTRTAKQFLDEFSTNVVPIEYTDEWSYSEGECRTITASTGQMRS